MNKPLVSCIAVLRAPLWLAKESIRSFLEQSYEPRELLLRAEGDARFTRAIEEYVRALALPNVRLGGTEDAAGEVFCAWPGHVLSHPQRIDAQLRAIAEAEGRGGYFTDFLVSRWFGRELLWIDAGPELAPMTLMAARDVYDAPEGAADFARIDGVAALVVSVAADDEWEKLTESARLAGDVRLARPMLRATLPAHRLPRPCLLRAREAGSLITLDPFEDEVRYVS